MKKKGLIAEPDRRLSRYREYNTPFIERLLITKEIQKLGFTLSEIDKLLNMRFKDGATTGQVKQFFEDKIARLMKN